MDVQIRTVLYDAIVNKTVLKTVHDFCMYSLVTRLTATIRFYIVRQNVVNWYAQSTMGICKTRKRSATPLGHPGIPRNAPLTGRNPPPPGLPLITKMRQKSYKTKP